MDGPKANVWSAFDLLYRCNVLCGTRAGLEENLLLLLSLKENQSWQASLFSGVPFCNYFFWIFWPAFSSKADLCTVQVRVPLL